MKLKPPKPTLLGLASRAELWGQIRLGSDSESQFLSDPDSYPDSCQFRGRGQSSPPFHCCFFFGFFRGATHDAGVHVSTRRGHFRPGPSDGATRSESGYWGRLDAPPPGPRLGVERGCWRRTAGRQLGAAAAAGRPRADGSTVTHLVL